MRGAKTSVILSVMNQRRHIRFQPDQSCIVKIDINAGPHSSSFSPQLCGFAISEAYGGCGVAVPATDQLKKGQTCRVQIGEIGPLSSKIAWIKSVDEEITKVGIEFLE